jgi:hypothetical protein
MVHLVPSRITYNAREIAELVFAEVYKLHGLPKSIVSNRDMLFTSAFWTHLNRLIGMNQSMSSAYHPQLDGATERANRTIGQMLRSCISSTQQDWVSKLPAIEFGINVSRSETTGYAPFFLNSGRIPRMFVWNDANSDEYPSVRAFAQRMKHVVMSAHDAILETRVKQARSANRKRQVAPFIVGDLAYVSTKNLSLPKGQARKLVPKFIGPYKLVRDFRNNSFKLDLPPCLRQRGIQPVFHSSLLQAHILNDDCLFPGRLETQVADFGEAELEWSVERILSHQGSGTDALFEVKWTSEDVTWMSYVEISHLAVLTEYLALIEVEKFDNLPQGGGEPPNDDPQIYNGLCCVCITLSHPDLLCHSSLFDSRVMDDLHCSHNILQHRDNFIFVDPEGTGQYIVPRWHLHLCLEYSKQIHTAIFRNHMEPAPIGYFLIARTFNNELGVNSSFSMFDEDGRWLTSQMPEPAPQTFFSGNPPAPPPNATQARSAELANTIADSELAQRHCISRSVEERIRKQGQGNNLPTYGFHRQGE